MYLVPLAAPTTSFVCAIIDIGPRVQVDSRSAIAHSAVLQVLIHATRNPKSLYSNDRTLSLRDELHHLDGDAEQRWTRSAARLDPLSQQPVSYTHLTLPTILRV